MLVLDGSLDGKLVPNHTMEVKGGLGKIGGRLGGTYSMDEEAREIRLLMPNSI